MGDSQDFQLPYWCLVCLHLAGPLIDSVKMKRVNVTQYKGERTTSRLLS